MNTQTMGTKKVVKYPKWDERPKRFVDPIISHRIDAETVELKMYVKLTAEELEKVCCSMMDLLAAHFDSVL